MWSFFKEGLLIRDPTKVYASAEQCDYFIKRAERQIKEVEGNYIYKNESNIFIQKLQKFVRGKLQREPSADDVTDLKEYLTEYLPYRQYEVIAFVRDMLSAFEWTQISTLLADIMHEEDMSYLKTDVYRIKETEIIGEIECSSSRTISSKDNDHVESSTMQLVPYLRKPWVCESIWLDEQTIIGRSSLDNLKFIRRLHPLRQDRLRWLMRKNLISKHFFFHLTKKGIYKLTRDTFNMYTLWYLFSTGFIRINPSFLFESSFTLEQQQAMILNLVGKGRLQWTGGHYVLKTNCFRSVLRNFVFDILKKKLKRADFARTRAYLLEYIPFRHYDIVAEIQRLSEKYPLNQLRELLEKELGVHFIGDNYQVESPATEAQQRNMQLVPHLRRPRVCESIWLDEKTTTGRNSLANLELIRQLDPLRRDRLRWLVHKNLISIHFFIHLTERGILKLTSDTFGMYALWDLFNNGLLRMNPSCLFESSFTLEQQQAMMLNLSRKSKLQQIGGHYVLKSNRFKSILRVFLSDKLNKQSYDADPVRSKAYLLEYIPSRHYDIVAEIQRLSGKYPLNRLRELLEKELGVYLIGELGSRVCDLKQIEVSIERLDDGSIRIEISDTCVESLPINGIPDPTIGNNVTNSQNAFDCRRISIKLQNNEGLVASNMQIVPYLPCPWEVSGQTNIFEDSCKKRSGLTVQKESPTVKFDTTEEEEIAVLRCLNEVQRDRIRWLLKKNLLSKLYYKYFSLIQLRNITRSALARENLWSYFSFGYLTRDPDFLFETSQSLNLQPTNAQLKETPSGFRRRTLFRRKFHSFLLSALSHPDNECSIVRSYVSEYANHRYEELAKILRYWSLEYPWSELSDILKTKLSLRNIEELERRVYGSSAIDKLLAVEKPRYEMQIVPYIPHPWKTSEKKGLFGKSNGESNKPRSVKTSTPEIDTMKKPDIDVLRCLNATQKDRLQWLVDNKLLCESYYDYFSVSELKFISKDVLCLPKLWHMFFDGYLIKNPEDLFGKEVSLELKKEFYIQYQSDKLKTHIDFTDSDGIVKEAQAFLERSYMEIGRMCKGIRNQRDIIQDQEFCTAMTFSQKFVSYILLYMKARQNDGDVLSILRKYLLDYLPFRWENVIVILEHIVKKYPWSSLKVVFEDSLPIFDISSLEERLFRCQGGRITDCVRRSEIRTTVCMQIVPHIPLTRRIMKNNVPDESKKPKIEIDKSSEFQLTNKSVSHLTELEKDRLRWLLTRKFLNVSYYHYFSAEELKLITKNPLSLYVLWFLFEYGYITRDPGSLFESDIPVDRQRELACNLYDKYTTNQFRRKFGTYLGLSIKSEQTSTVALNNHKNYVLEYVPYRYEATISYLKQYLVFTKHPWKKISYTLEKDGVIQNISELEIAIFGSEQSCGKQIINSAVQKEV
nr:unnamed protein product [Callosobruchus analis]